MDSTAIIRTALVVRRRLRGGVYWARTRSPRAVVGTVRAGVATTGFLLMCVPGSVSARPLLTIRSAASRGSTSGASPSGRLGHGLGPEDLQDTGVPEVDEDPGQAPESVAEDELALVQVHDRLDVRGGLLDAQ